MKENQRAYDFPAEGSRPHAAEADELTWFVKAEIKALYQPQLLSQSPVLASASLITSFSTAVEISLALREENKSLRSIGTIQVLFHDSQALGSQVAFKSLSLPFVDQESWSCPLMVTVICK